MRTETAVGDGMGLPLQVYIRQSDKRTSSAGKARPAQGLGGKRDAAAAACTDQRAFAFLCAPLLWVRQDDEKHRGTLRQRERIDVVVKG